jgi:hypothetical protein
MAGRLPAVDAGTTGFGAAVVGLADVAATRDSAETSTAATGFWGSAMAEGAMVLVEEPAPGAGAGVAGAGPTVTIGVDVSLPGDGPYVRSYAMPEMTASDPSKVATKRNGLPPRAADGASPATLAGGARPS